MTPEEERIYKEAFDARYKEIMDMYRPSRIFALVLILVQTTLFLIMVYLIVSQ